MDCNHNFAFIVRKRTKIITDLFDDFTRLRLIINLRRGRYFSHNQQRVKRRRAFHRRASIGVRRQNSVQNPVGNIVAHLIGMPFRHTLARKKFLHSTILFRIFVHDIITPFRSLCQPIIACKKNSFVL